ncbi:thiamine phosphate synthase [Microvirga antarctica]|uniref:thiamine phosphate synthase n=1 Tax=Microvirga antarctica TaxID=2819233 RepID=UPI001B315522|nr:thiamine phosphate synthase [Microvirga antarctica]
MVEPAARLYLITPLVEDAAAFAPALAEACAGGEVAAVLLRLPKADERTLVNQIKALSAAVQEHGTALIIASDGAADLALVASRAAADGIHVPAGGLDLKDQRDRVKADRTLGVGAIRSKDDAMTAGEAGVDYLLFGEPRQDGSIPALEGVVDRATWWAEIFETPCVVFAPSFEAIPALVATRAEFIALGDAVWHHPEGPAKAVSAAIALIGDREAD